MYFRRSGSLRLSLLNDAWWWYDLFVTISVDLRQQVRQCFSFCLKFTLPRIASYLSIIALDNLRYPLLLLKHHMPHTSTFQFSLVYQLEYDDRPLQLLRLSRWVLKVRYIISLLLTPGCSQWGHRQKQWRGDGVCLYLPKFLWFHWDGQHMGNCRQESNQKVCV